MNNPIARPSSSTPERSTSTGSSGTGGLSGDGSSTCSSSSLDGFGPFPNSVAATLQDSDQTLMNDLRCDFMQFSLQTSPTDSRKTSESSSYMFDDNQFCEEHRMNKDYFCFTCVLEVCVECVKTKHNQHYLYPGLSCRELFEETNKLRRSVKENAMVIDRQLQDLHFSKLASFTNIQQFFHNVREIISAREKQLLTIVSYIADCRSRILDEKLKEHETAITQSTQTTNNLLDSMKIGNPEMVLQASRSAKRNLEILRSTQRNYQYQEEEVHFIMPDDGLVNAIKEMGAISSVHNNNPQQSNFNRFLSSSFNLYDNYSAMFSAFSSTDTGLVLPFLEKTKETKMAMIDDGYQDTSSMFPVSFHTNRNYSRIKKPVTVFGTEGPEEGQLCRPWGVCCDPSGQVIVADRSNNRIQIFRLDGSFVRAFGTHGSDEGQLNRPAGVAIDYYGRIIVTDKDNHRVQIFTMEGKFVFQFGDRGSANGKFHYPWDVDVNSLGMIVISDTRNHRIQVFSGNGVFLKKFGFESMSNMWKFFDSPRGVCFTASNTIMVTDFNNHRVYEIDIEKTPQLINSEHFKKCDLFRPQGIAIDPDGNVLVADCRNNRIQVFDKVGMPIGQFGVPGKEPGQFDRPSGIALTSDGKIVVVDFGNHRIQIF